MQAILIQAIGFLGVIFFIISYQIRSNRMLFLMQMLGNLVCGSHCWLVYDLLIGSWGGVLNEAITPGSILVSIRRYGWRNMGDPNAGF